MIAKRHFCRALLGLVFLCWVAGCAPTHIAMDVKSHAAPDFHVPPGGRFSFLPPEGEKPLKEKILPLIRGEMEKKGLVYDNARPHILVMVKADTRTGQRRKPVVSRPVPSLQPSREGATLQTNYVIEGGGFYTVQIRWIRMDIFDAAGRKPGKPGDELWQGEVESEGEEDASIVAKCLISGLLSDYPAGHGKSRKILKLDECR